MEAPGTGSTGPPCCWSFTDPRMMLLTEKLKKSNLGGEMGDCLLLALMQRGLGTGGFVIHYILLEFKVASPVILLSAKYVMCSTLTTNMS